MERIQRKVEELSHNKKSSVNIRLEDLTQHGLRNITLRSYQLAGVNWLVERYNNNHGCILGDEMGLGKTCQTIAFLVHLYGSKKGTGPFLILCPLSVIGNWQNEIKRFAPDLDLVSYIGSKEVREGPLRAAIKKKRDKLCVILTTYETLLKDKPFLQRRAWHTLVVDEAHRLKNRDSLLHQNLLDFDIEHRVLLTGTPVQNNLKELYSLLCFVAPNIFKEKYVEEFVHTYNDVGENKDDASELHGLLKPFLLRRVKAEVVKDLPRKSEIVLYHGMSALQKKYYKAILTKDVGVFENLNAAGTSRTSLMNILMQLRKCMNHPYLFDGVEPEPFELGEHLVEASGKMIVLDQLLKYLRSKGHKVLVFSQMTRMLDVLQDYLGYRGYTYERLDGSVRGEERYLAVQNFNEDDETFIFLLSTKAGGVGLNLVGADTVIFIDSDFNPQNDLQAAARAHRIGQTRPVKVIRLLGRSTVEEIVFKRAEAKLKLTETVIEGGQFSLDASNKKEELIADSEFKLQDILKFGVEKLFATDDSTVEDIDLDNVLGKSERGQWKEDEQVTQTQATLAASSMDIEEDDDEENTMYMFEGTDYSKEQSNADNDAFQKLLQDKHAVAATESLADDGGRALRKTKTSLLPGFACEVGRRAKKVLSEEEKEERKKKREEAAAKRAKAAEEARIQKRNELWKSNGYKSCNIAMDSEDEEIENGAVEITSGQATEEEEDGGDSLTDHSQIHYLVGDVTRPQNAADRPAFVVHCLDDSGSWGSGGLFSAISKRSDEPENHYTLAGDMKDLSLGDVHLASLPDCARDGGEDYMALIIAQHRDKRRGLSGIKLSALSQALKRICKAAKQLKASVHLPRIGHNTPGFNWYGTERLIRKHLCSKAIPTYIYYYPRKQKLKRKATGLSPQAASSNGEDLNDAVPSTASSEVQQPMKKQNTGSTDSKERDTDGSVVETQVGFTGGESTSMSESFMDDTRCFFYHLPQELVKKLSKLLIKYDGDVHKSVSEGTTYIVVDDSSTRPQDLEAEWYELMPFTDLKVVRYQWLEECFRRKRNVNNAKWLLDWSLQV